MADAPLLARIRAQWLADRPGPTVASVAAHTTGLQAQDTAAMRLSVRARSQALTAASVRDAGRDRSVVRTWLMRGTLHLVAAADVRWMLGLFGARNRAAASRRRAQLGLDDATCDRALAMIPEILAGGPLRRADLIGRLTGDGLAVDPSGQAPAHLIMYAATSGLICRGPDLDGRDRADDEPGYVLLDSWLPAATTPAFTPEVALAELTRRYLGAFGPAGPPDLATWSGLPVGTASRGFALVADELVPSGEGYALAGPTEPADVATPVVRLLGAFDTYLLGYRPVGYRGRADILPAAHAKRILPGGGIIHPAVLVDGRIVGRWRRRGDLVDVEPFTPLTAAVRSALVAEVDDLGRFVGREVKPGRW